MRSTLVLLLTALLSGCLTATVTLDPTGGGTMVYTYFPPKHATYGSERARLSSSAVTVTDLEGGESSTATLRFADATTLATAEAFRDVAVTRTRDGDIETLTIVVPPMPAPLRKAALDTPLEGAKNKGPVIALTLPGPVVDATPAAEIDGPTVRWSITLRDFAALDRWDLSVRWRVPGEAAAGTQSM